MDYLYLEKLSCELNEKLKRGRVVKVFLDGPKFSMGVGDYFLNFYSGTPNFLFLSRTPITDRESGKLSLLKGTYVKEFFLPKKDRVLFLKLVKLLPSGKFKPFNLVFELTGRNANLLLLNEEGEILYLLREPKSSVRPLKVGSLYSFPPFDKKPFEEIRFGEVTPEGVKKKLYKFVEGLSPLNSREIALLFKRLGSLEEAYREFLEKHKSSKEAYLYFEDERPKYLTTFPYESLSHLKFKEFSGELPFSRASEEFYRLSVEREELEKLRSRVVERLDSEIESLSKQIDELSDVGALKKEAERLRRWGELLKYEIGRLRGGESEVEVFDYQENKKIRIPLDPSLSPRENLNRIFGRYRKINRKVEFSLRKLSELREKLKNLQVLREIASETEDEDFLLELSRSSDRKEGEKLKFNFYVLPSGKKILVGRNSRENEFLSLKVANPWDFWFHAKEIPGSHVILRLQKGEEPTEEDIRLAASAAAFFSKGKNSGKVAVDYTRVSNLKKPPKSPVGFVTYRGEKTIYVYPDEFKEFLEEAPRGGR